MGAPPCGSSYHGCSGWPGKNHHLRQGKGKGRCGISMGLNVRVVPHSQTLGRWKSGSFFPAISDFVSVSSIFCLGVPGVQDGSRNTKLNLSVRPNEYFQFELGHCSAFPHFIGWSTLGKGPISRSCLVEVPKCSKPRVPKLSQTYLTYLNHILIISRFESQFALVVSPSNSPVWWTTRPILSQAFAVLTADGKIAAQLAGKNLRIQKLQETFGVFSIPPRVIGWSSTHPYHPLPCIHHTQPVLTLTWLVYPLYFSRPGEFCSFWFSIRRDHLRRPSQIFHPHCCWHYPQCWWWTLM